MANLASTSTEIRKKLFKAGSLSAEQRSAVASELAGKMDMGGVSDAELSAVVKKLRKEGVISKFEAESIKRVFRD